MNNINFKKILILRFGAIGDVVHTTALFRSLKKYCPDFEIHYATFKAPSALIENDKDLNKVWILQGKSYKQLFELAKVLRKEKFDVFLNLQPSLKTKIFSVIVGAKKNLTYKKTFKLHAVENFWRTAKSFFKDIVLDNELKIYLPQDSREKIRNLVFDKKNIIGLNIGAAPERQGRKWSIDHWIELSVKIIEKYDCQIVLTGSKEDEKDAKILVAKIPQIKSFCGELSLAESAVLLERCNLVISGDTGPLHIATAVKTRVVGLYGSMPISRTGPYGNIHFALKSDMDCIPCNRRKCKLLKRGESCTPCLRQLLPEMLLKVIEENSLLD